MLVLCVFSSVLSVFCVCFVVCPRSGGALIFLLATASREAVLCVVRLCVFSVFLCRAMAQVLTRLCAPRPAICRLRVRHIVLAQLSRDVEVQQGTLSCQGNVPP